MSLEEAWKLYLSPGGKSVENRNRIISMLYGPLITRLTEHLNEKYVDAVTSEAGFVLTREVEHATRPLSVSELAKLTRRKNFKLIDFTPGDAWAITAAESGVIDVFEHYVDRERESWKTGPDSAVDDPTIRQRPISAALIAAEKHSQTAGAESFLVREPTA